MDPRIERLAYEQALPYADTREPLQEQELLLARVYEAWRGKVLLYPDCFKAEGLYSALKESCF